MRGEFVLIVLFKSYLLLATPSPTTAKYTTNAIISLGDLRVERPDNGRGTQISWNDRWTLTDVILGLQCHTALYAWKVAFESEHRLYEVILCACSSLEEEQWKTRLAACADVEEQRQREDHALSLPIYSFLNLDMKAVGHVFGAPGTMERRLSVQRASTMNPRNSTYQVIIKNTNDLRNAKDQKTSPSSSIGRSQSHLTTNRISILAPKRSERARMEHQLAGVWTRELLPYPGYVFLRPSSLCHAIHHDYIKSDEACRWGYLLIRHILQFSDYPRLEMLTPE